MSVFNSGKDGGPESTVTGFWLCEFKRLFSVVLLRFADGSRDAYHSHAFNCVSWVLSGMLIERHIDGSVEIHRPSLWPVITKRETFHKVVSEGVTWVLSFRGPWRNTWKEYLPAERRERTLSLGRVEV